MANPADVALLLSRTSFYVPQSKVQQLAQMDWDQVLATVVDQATPPKAESWNYQIQSIYQQSEYNDFQAIEIDEMNRLSDPALGLGDRMLWFWHGLLTSNWDKVFETPLLLRQHQLLAKNALGNFRQIMYDITIDAAMVLFLDLNFSSASNPNENYAREVMELFTLGRGNYTQDDVRAGALAFAGWFLDFFPQNPGAPYNPNKIQVAFSQDFAYSGPLTFLGSNLTMDGSQTQYQQIIDTIFAFQPQPGKFPSSEYVVTKLFEYFVHPGPDADTVSNLAGIFRGANFEVTPVLSALFRHPDFLNSRGARARYPLEVVLAMAAGFGIPVQVLGDFQSFLAATGQVLFDPPNVAGWPMDNRWLSASQAIARADLAFAGYSQASNHVIKKIAKAADPVTAALNAMNIYNASAETVSALTQAGQSVSNSKARARLLLTLAALTPEFGLA